MKHAESIESTAESWKMFEKKMKRAESIESTAESCKMFEKK